MKQFQPGQGPVGVYFEGVCKKLEPGEELDAAFKALNGHFQIGEEKLEEAKDPNGHQFYKISVENWYVFGNLDGQGAKKYQLAWHRN